MKEIYGFAIDYTRRNGHYVTISSGESVMQEELLVQTSIVRAATP